MYSISEEARSRLNAILTGSVRIPLLLGFLTAFVSLEW